MKEAAQPNAVRQPLLCNHVLESIEDVCYFSRYGFEENAPIYAVDTIKNYDGRVGGVRGGFCSVGADEY